MDGRDASDASAARGSKERKLEEPPLVIGGGLFEKGKFPFEIGVFLLKKEFSSLKKDWQGRG